MNFGDIGKLGSLMKNAGKIQKMMQENQEKLAQTIILGEAGAGMVKIEMTAKYNAVNLNISDEAMKEDKEVLQDLIVAAINDATRKIEKLTQESMMDAGKMFGIDGSDQ